MPNSEYANTQWNQTTKHNNGIMMHIFYTIKLKEEFHLFRKGWSKIKEEETEVALLSFVPCHSG